MEYRQHMGQNIYHFFSFSYNNCIIWPVYYYHYFIKSKSLVNKKKNFKLKNYKN